jgi:hypothetical protein
MASGTITFDKSKSSGTYIQGRVVWEATADKAANASTDVSATLYVKKDDPKVNLTVATSGNWSYSLTVNGSKVSGTVYKSVLTDWVKIKTKTISKIAHGSDGKKSIEISGWVKAPTGTALEGHKTSGEKTVSLDTIPRATSFESLSCSTGYFTGTLTYKYTPKSSSFYNKCDIALNVNGTLTAIKTIKIGKLSAAQQTATETLTNDELKVIYDQLPNVDRGKLRLTIRTYSDSGYSTQIGDAVYKELDLNIPNDTTTQADVSMSLSPVGSLPDAFAGLYVQGKTMVKAEMSAEGKFNATINSYSMKVDGITYDSNDDYTSEYLSKAGKFSVTGYAKDSRGYTGSTQNDITVIGYIKPKILNVEVSRCDKDGNIADDGTYLKIKAERSYSPVKSDGVQYNFCEIQYRYKLASAESYSPWATILGGYDLDSDQVETNALLDGTLSVASTYQVQVLAIDVIGERAWTDIVIPTDIVHNHKARNGWGFGKYCEGENLLDVAWDARFHGMAEFHDATSFHGDTSFAGPTGFQSDVDFQGDVSIKLNGKLVSVLEIIYPVGAIYISTANQNPQTLFGFGEWEQIKDKFLLAAGSSYSAGSSGGAPTVALKTEHMPSHTHDLKLASSNNTGSITTQQLGLGKDSGTIYTNDNPVVAKGSGKAHENMPPYLAVYIWKRMS